MDVLDKYPPKEGWKWFNVIGWSLVFDEGDEILKDDFHKVLEEKIPMFESEIAEGIQDE